MSTYLVISCFNWALSYVPFVTVRASKPWGGQVHMCLHVLAGVEDPTAGSGGWWTQWFKRAVSSVCIFPSVPLASAGGPSWMKTLRCFQKWHHMHLSRVQDLKSAIYALDPHCLQETTLTKKLLQEWSSFALYLGFWVRYLSAWHKEDNQYADMGDFRAFAFLSVTDRAPLPSQISPAQQECQHTWWRNNIDRPGSAHLTGKLLIFPTIW